MFAVHKTEAEGSFPHTAMLVSSPRTLFALNLSKPCASKVGSGEVVVSFLPHLIRLEVYTYSMKVFFGPFVFPPSLLW
jgi:hypothetical protein